MAMDYVITGGPSAGKSSVVRELSSRGYNTIPEAARLLIDQAVSEGIDPNDLHGTRAFQQNVEEKAYDIERYSNPEAVTFLDRSIVDSIAYRRFLDFDVPDDVRRIGKDRYESVFLLDRLDFEDDYARHENEETARIIHSLIEEVYEDLGYKVTEVPVMHVSDRADFIVEEVINDR